MSAVEKAAEVLAAHADDGCGDCICSEYVLDDTLAAHVAQALADAGLLDDPVMSDHTSCVESYTTLLLRAEAAERALATLRADVAALVTGPTADAWHDEAARGTAVLPYASNRYVRLVDDIRAALARGTR